MPRLERTTSDNPDFISLVEKLDSYLTKVDGNEHDFYDQFNSIENLNHVVVARIGEQPLGCGALKAFDAESMEVKRMYVEPEHRGTGVAGEILSQLERWAAELGARYCILETGKRQVEAVKFYKKSGYSVIPNYPPYKGVENSICFRKEL